MPKLPVCKGKEAVKAFEKHSWSLARYIDDHFILKKQGERFLLSVPDHNPLKSGMQSLYLKCVIKFIQL
jgi:predicted RNA binding protein YcfA (HicA-like mRNA interferase family)